MKKEKRHITRYLQKSGFSALPKFWNYLLTLVLNRSFGLFNRHFAKLLDVGGNYTDRTYDIRQD